MIFDSDLALDHPLFSDDRMNIPLFQGILDVFVHSLAFFGGKGVYTDAGGHGTCYELMVSS